MELWGVRGDIRDFALALGFTEHSIRIMIQDQSENGLKEITVRRGGDILATPEDFVKWLNGYCSKMVDEEGVA